MNNFLKSKTFVFFSGSLFGILIGIFMSFKIAKFYYNPMGMDFYFPRTVMDQFFHQFQNQMFKNPKFEKPFEDPFSQAPSANDMEITEDAKNIYYHLEIDGLDPQSLNVSIENDQVSVQGKVEQLQGGMHFSSSFFKRFPAPTGVQADRFTTEFKDKKLTIQFPKN